MTLLYVWCERLWDSYKGDAAWADKGYGFNLGGPLRFSFDPQKNELSISENKQHFDDFFSYPFAEEGVFPVSNISVIAGKNGVGKTSALQALVRSVFDYRWGSINRGSNWKTILITLNRGNISIACMNMERPKHNGAKDFPQYRWEGLRNLFAGQMGFYYSGGRRRGANSEYAIEDLQASCRFQDCSPKTDEGPQSIRNMRMLSKLGEQATDNILRQINLPKEARLDSQINRFRIFANLMEGQGKKQKLISHKKAPNYANQHDFFMAVNQVTKVPTIKALEQDDKFLTWFKKGLNSLKYFAYFDFLVTLSPSPRWTVDEHPDGGKGDFDFFDRLIDELPSPKKGEENQWERYRDILKILTTYLNQNVLDYKGKAWAAFSFIQYLDSLENVPNLQMEIVPLPSDLTSADIKLVELTLPLKLDHDGAGDTALVYAEKYYDIFYKPSLANHLFSFRNMSQGEYALLDLRTSLFEAAEQARRLNNTNIFFFLDEPDVFLHPQWEKEFIYTLIKDSSLLFEGMTVQFVISTNKPVMLSDVPNTNVVFMKEIRDNSLDKIISIYDEDRKQTFMQNIHTLYKNSFFVEGSLIGNFAEKWLYKLVQEIEDPAKWTNLKEEATQKEIQRIDGFIPLIGEEILRIGLQEKLQEKLKAKLSLDQEIEYYKKILAAKEQARDRQRGQYDQD